MKKANEGFFKQTITKEQSKDTGMAIVLILLLIGFFRESHAWSIAAMVVHVLNMIAPRIYRIPARFWFGLSHVMGTVASTILLSVTFAIVVVPIGLIRRWMGKDAMRLKEFKAGSGSVMRERNHTFTGADIEKPY